MSMNVLPLGNNSSHDVISSGFFEGNLRDDGTSIHVTQMVLRETGTYNKQYNRTYDTMVTSDHLKVFGERMQENPSHHFTPTRVAGLLSDMLHISAMPSDNNGTAIDGGWGDRRLVFVLTVDVGQALGVKRYVIQGYTNYSGVSLEGSLDPDMVFFVNNIIEMREDQIRTPMGIRSVPAMTSNYQVLSNVHQRGAAFQKVASSVRPQDVFGIMSLNTVAPFSENQVYASSHVVQGKPMASRRGNNNPAAYAATILNGYAEPHANIQMGQDQSDIMTQAIDASRENLVSENKFMRALASHSVAGTVTSQFPLRDLFKLDPRLQTHPKEHINFIVQAPTQRNQQHIAGSTSDWNGGDIETKYAATLSNAFPAIMMDCMLSELSVTFTNTKMGGFWFMPEKVKSFTSLDATEFILRCMQRVEREIMNDLSYMNDQAYDITISCSVFGETFVSVQINNRARIDYVTPSFCDGLITPVISPDKDQAYNISSEMTRLAAYATNQIGVESFSPTNTFSPNNNLV